MTRHIFFTRAIPSIASTMLTEKGYTVVCNPKDRALAERDLMSQLKKNSYDAVVTLLTDTISTRVYDAAPSVKLYANYATGYDNIDVGGAKARGISVTNAPTEISARSVAQHTVALILALTNRIVEADRFVKRGKFEGWAPMQFVGMSVDGKTLGLVGSGAIGIKVAHDLSLLGMKIIYTDLKRNTELEETYHARYCESLDELLKEADVVSLHVPLLASTHHLIDARRLALMKPTSILINTARGAVIDEYALELALKKGIIAGAALDVFEHEPSIRRGLRRLPNVVLTPHIASASTEARTAMAVIVAQNIIDFFEGRIPTNSITI